MNEKFVENHKNRHEYARKWKEKNPNGKVMDYLCTYLSEEILYEPNILSIGIKGDREPRTAGIYIKLLTLS